MNGARNTSRLMEWALDFSFSSSNDSALKVYALSDHYSDFETYEVWSQLTDIKNANPSIDSVYLINDYTSTVIDSRLGLNDTATFFTTRTLLSAYVTRKQRTIACLFRELCPSLLPGTHPKK
ncbi:hypothetical protein ACFTAO_49135 [Paenibacillus rhizoplanae]